MFEDFQSSSDDHCIVKLRDDVPPEDMLYNGVSANLILILSYNTFYNNPQLL